jgi:two-component system aerobic respiration control sensor histidine kinase ArcB
MKDQIKVLVVEDHDVAQRMARLILDGLGCDLHIAGSGAEALALFEQHHYDLIFMDIGLPDMDGLTVTATIRTRENKANPTPIVGLTAHSNEKMRRQAMEAGMDDFLPKPLMKENCLAMLNKFVVKV